MLLTVPNPKHISLTVAPSDVLQANDIAPLPSPRKSLVMPKVEDQEEEPETLTETKQALQVWQRSSRSQFGTSSIRCVIRLRYDV